MIDFFPRWLISMFPPTILCQENFFSIKHWRLIFLACEKWCLLVKFYLALNYNRNLSTSNRGIHVNPWLIHVNVWQNPLQYCKVVSLQLIRINEKKKETLIPKGLFWHIQHNLVQLRSKVEYTRTSLVVKRLRIRHAMQGTLVPSLVGEWSHVQGRQVSPLPATTEPAWYN